MSKRKMLQRGSYRKAGKSRSLIDIPTSFQGVRPQIPLLRVRGARPGPLTAVTACQHGREINGIVSVAESFSQICEDEVSGDIIFLPVMNPLAVRMHQQEYPFEYARFCQSVTHGCNMNRSWNVKDERRDTYAGTITEFVWKNFLRYADLILDFHGWASLSLAWTLKKDMETLLAFGLPWNVLIKQQTHKTEEGFLETASYSSGITHITVELSPQNILSNESVEYGRRGIMNLLYHTGQLKGKPELPAEQYIFPAEGEKDIVVKSPSEGIVVFDVVKGQIVQKGERILRILSLDTLETIYEAEAPQRSVVFFKDGGLWGDHLPSDITYPGQMVALLKVIKETIRNK
jgi:predicted deacylase